MTDANGAIRDAAVEALQAIEAKANQTFFGRFFQNLFLQMQSGVTMPMAWIGLAPVNGVPRDYPDTVTLMKVTHIAFKRTWRSRFIERTRATLKRLAPLG
jgi:hypothetical protein